MKIKPLSKRILAELLGLEERVSAGGIILKADNGKDHGIRPRWALIKYVGDGIDWSNPATMCWLHTVVGHEPWKSKMTKAKNSKLFAWTTMKF